MTRIYEEFRIQQQNQIIQIKSEQRTWIDISPKTYKCEIGTWRDQKKKKIEQIFVHPYYSSQYYF